jgi:hypothetical protein
VYIDMHHDSPQKMKRKEYIIISDAQVGVLRYPFSVCPTLRPIATRIPKHTGALT